MAAVENATVAGGTIMVALGAGGTGATAVVMAVGMVAIIPSPR